ncbi:MAG: hypothetical protein NZM25_09535 [Leptospiraceae bacterium]|nr:hypothetical protein [Leptospiraceae bacterium]MDW8306399.1 hypothetical protein [Leptospiraceae bacterium]
MRRRVFLEIFLITTSALGAISDITLRTIGDVPLSMARWHRDRLQSAMGRIVPLYGNSHFAILGLPQVQASNFLPYEGTPWQLWSAQLGLGLFYRIKDGFSLFTGTYARRDHITDQESYASRFLWGVEPHYYNRYLRRYEYFFSQFDLILYEKTNIRLSFTTNHRFYLRLFAPLDPPGLVAYNGGHLELGYGSLIRAFWGIYAEYFWLRYGSLLSGYRESYRYPPSFGYGLEGGVRWPFSHYQNLQFIIGYRSTPGRQFDFVERISGIDLTLSLHTYLEP